MTWLIFLLFGHAYAACLNDGILEDGVCSCVGGYSGRHCQIQPYNTPCTASDRDNFVKLQNLGANDQAQVGVKTLDVCNGTNFPCYYRPGLPASNKCLPQFGVDCPDNFSVNMSATCEDGCHPDVFQGFCCAEHAKCEDRGCEDTKGQDTDIERLVYNAGGKGYVISHIENGACKYDDWYFNKVPLYKTIYEVLKHCQTFVGFGDYGYVCFQTRYFCTGTPVVCRNIKSDPVVHRASCDETQWWLTWQNSVPTYDDESSSSVTRQVKTYTATEVQVDLTEYYNSLDSDGAECCNYEKVCEDYNSGCVFPLKNIGSNSSQDGEEASECCEPKKWRCDHSGYSCNPGFMVNTKKCGRQCNASFDTTITGILSYTQLTSGTVHCSGDEQAGITSVSGCFDICKNDYTHFYMNGNKCFCTNDLTGRCAIHGCEWCPQGITRDIVYGEYAAVCRGATTCPSGWFELSGDCIKGDSMSYGDGCIANCYIPDVSGNPGCDLCCDPKMLDTYSIDTGVFKDTSFCCEVDNDVSFASCRSLTCPRTFTEKADTDMSIYAEQSGDNPELNPHFLNTCCNITTHIHYCDLHDNLSPFDCPNGFILNYDNADCGGNCTIDKCCVEESNYCEYYECPVGDTLLYTESYCGGNCTKDQCCITEPHYCRYFDCVGEYVNKTSVFGETPQFDMETHNCGTDCEQDDCCMPKTHSCSSVTCNATQVHYSDRACDGVCSVDFCCEDMPSCDVNHACTDPSSVWYINGMINTSYLCSDIVSGACAPSEYEGTDKCCIVGVACNGPDEWSRGYTNTDLPFTADYNYPSEYQIVLNPKDGCEDKPGYVSRYIYGTRMPQSFLGGAYYSQDVFSEYCCQYYQLCTQNMCDTGQVLKYNSITEMMANKLYCWDDTMDSTTVDCPQSTECCAPDSCLLAGRRFSCPADKSIPGDSNVAVGRILDESDYQTTCCSAPSPFSGGSVPEDLYAELIPEAKWGGKVVARHGVGGFFVRDSNGLNFISQSTATDRMEYDGNHVYTQDKTGTLKKWDLNGLSHVSYSNDIWNVPGGFYDFKVIDTVIATIKQGKLYTGELGASYTGKQQATLSGSTTIYVTNKMDMAKDTENNYVVVFQQEKTITWYEISTTGNWYPYSKGSHFAQVYEYASCKSSFVSAPVLRPDGSRALTVTRDCNGVIYLLESKKNSNNYVMPEEHPLSGISSCSEFVLTEANKIALACTTVGSVYIYNSDLTHANTITIPSLSGKITSLNFNPNDDDEILISFSQSRVGTSQYSQLYSITSGCIEGCY